VEPHTKEKGQRSSAPAFFSAEPRLVDVVPQGALKTRKLLKTRSEENYGNDGMGRLLAKFRPKILRLTSKSG